MLRIVAVTVILCAVATASLAQGTPALKTVWDGVYTDEQATRGKQEYANHCQRCHGPELTDTREIVGSRFLERWREDRLDTLFNYVRDAMPRQQGRSLQDDTYLDIFTYMLARNGFPAGKEPLAISQLLSIYLYCKNGRQTVPDGALVVTVVCMKRGPGNVWLLTNATEPRRTRTPRETTQEELSAAQASAAGPHTFILADFDAVNASRPENFEGLRLQAKGFLVRAPGAERSSLFHLALISSKCP